MPPPDELDLIHAYTDENALEDGVIVAITKKHRATNGVFVYQGEHAPEGDNGPPQNWPVPLLEWMAAKTDNQKAMALARGFIEGHTGHAERCNGDLIVDCITNPQTDKIVSVELDAAQMGRTAVAIADQQRRHAEGRPGRRMWMLKNECDGYTLMFPEEY